MQQEGPRGRRASQSKPAEGWFHYVLPILFCQERYDFYDFVSQEMEEMGSSRTELCYIIASYGSLLGPTNYKLNCAWLYGRSNELQQHFLPLQLLVHLSRFVVYSHQPKMVVVCDSLVIDAQTGTYSAQDDGRPLVYWFPRFYTSGDHLDCTFAQDLLYNLPCPSCSWWAWGAMRSMLRN